MNLTLKRLLGAAAAVATGATALLGTGVGTADAAGRVRVHCDRAERPLWSEGPSRNLTAHGCDLPKDKRRWYVVEIDNLAQPDYKSDYLDGGVSRTETLRKKTLSCMGYTSEKGTVNWFGCPPR
ncbi:hypothetical protein ACWD5R_04445 [Streptomyces sp. NPDC002514]|uniref:hypothetical protein n=1 Tax=unclassified Streptomyces TaxID=2593676 RepID=UPI0036897AD7